ncbi:MAG: hypothetical protein L0H83_16310, partial [Salinisphaera sp.]|nr:hypothetical protein [Salinisphaera sp.]
VLRRYNHGLGTALVLFVPLGGTAWWLVQRADLASPLCHAVSLSFAVLVHVAILVHVRRKLHRITATDGVAAGGLAG